MSYAWCFCENDRYSILLTGGTDDTNNNQTSAAPRPLSFFFLLKRLQAGVEDTPPSNKNCASFQNKECSESTSRCKRREQSVVCPTANDTLVSLPTRFFPWDKTCLLFSSSLTPLAGSACERCPAPLAGSACARCPRRMNAPGRCLTTAPTTPLRDIFRV